MSVLLDFFNVYGKLFPNSSLCTARGNHADASEGLTGDCVGLAFGLEHFNETELSRHMAEESNTFVVLACPLMMKGIRMLMTSSMKRTTDAVTSVSNQFHVKATTRAATIVALYSINVASFSEIPSCRVLAVAVMVPVAYPGGIESRTWMVCAKSDFK